MAKSGKKQVYVRVKDGAGNKFLCRIDALKDIKKATDEGWRIVWMTQWWGVMQGRSK